MRIFLSLILAMVMSAPVYAADRDPLWFACQVRTDLGDGRAAVGSGTPVACEGGKTLILTNAHVVESVGRPITVTVAGKTYPARYAELSAHPEPDLAVLVIDATMDVVRIAAEVKPGEKVWQWGCAGGTAPHIKGGEVVGPWHGGSIGTSIPVENGDSGSGVFNDAGELVGVTFGVTHDSGRRLHLAVTLVEVRRFTRRDRVRAMFPRLAAWADTR